MSVLFGTVSNVKLSTEVVGSGSSDFSNVQTFHIASFSIDGKPVLLKIKSYPTIDNGDKIAVGGVLSGGQVNAFGYKNFTRGTGFISDFYGNIVLGFIAFVFGLSGLLYTLYSGFTNHFSWTTFIFIFVFGLIGFIGSHVTRFHFYIQKSLRALKKYSPQQI